MTLPTLCHPPNSGYETEAITSWMMANGGRGSGSELLAQDSQAGAEHQHEHCYPQQM
jgi:hypothetical protein